MIEYEVTVDDNGNKFWYLDGKFHRTDGPAVEYADGDKRWYLNGECHRTDGPAMEFADGTKAWYLNGECHRTDGPAIERADGDKFWYLNGNLHRTDGPAMEFADGTKEWYLNGNLHRTDGPAIERADGTKEWYLNGEELTEAQWREQVKPKAPCEGNMKFVANVLSPHVSHFCNFIDLNFPEVKLESQKFSYGFRFTFANVSVEDAKAIWGLWVDSYDSYEKSLGLA